MKLICLRHAKRIQMLIHKISPGTKVVSRNILIFARLARTIVSKYTLLLIIMTPILTRHLPSTAYIAQRLYTLQGAEMV